MMLWVQLTPNPLESEKKRRSDSRKKTMRRLNALRTSGDRKRNLDRIASKSKRKSRGENELNANKS